MALTEIINEDLKAAMKSGDSVKLNTIRSIRAQLIELSKRGTGTSITPEEEMTALLAAAKKRKEAIEMYKKAGRNILQIKKNVNLILSYLSSKTNEQEEVEILVKKIIGNIGATSSKDFSKVMPVAMKELKGKIDGKVIQEVVKKQLGE